MKRLSALLAATLMGAGLTVVTAPSASATAGCVNYSEYAAITGSKTYSSGMTTAKVHSIFDTSGYEIDRTVNFIYTGNGNYTESGDWVGYSPGEWVEDGYWFDGYWYDTSYWSEEQGGYARYVDTVRSYKKCASFDGGRGRVGVWYDNWYSAYSGNRVYTKHRSSPSTLASYMWASWNQFWDEYYSSFSGSARVAKKAPGDFR